MIVGQIEEKHHAAKFSVKLLVYSGHSIQEPKGGDGREDFFAALLMPGSTFYQLQSARLARIAGCAGVSPSECEDVVAEAWTDAVLHRDKFTTEGGLRSWLSKAVHHKAVSLFRRRDPLPCAESLDGQSAEPQDRNGAKGEQDKAMRGQVAAMLKRLRRKNRRDAWLVLQHCLKKRKLNDLAKKRGMTVNAIRNRICRAIEALRRFATAEDALG